MKLFFLFFLFLIAPLGAQDLRQLTYAETKPSAIASVPDHKLARRAVVISIVAMVAAKLADNATSIDCHCYETNPLFQTATGRYDSSKAIAINSAVFAPVIISELLYMKQHPNGSLLPAFTVFNGTIAVTSARVSYDNSRIR